MSQKNSDQKFLTHAMVVIGLVVLVGSVAAWRLGSNTSVDAGTDDSSVVADEGETIQINVASSGYSPSQITVQQGETVNLKLVTNNTYGCARGFTIPKLGIIKNLKSTGEDTVQFVAEEKGSFVFQCSMGMFRGTINVI